MESNFNPKDKVTVDIPLLIRLLEYAREDAKTDMDLHNVVENLISLSETGKTLTMSDYNSIVKQTKTNLMENSFNLKKFLVENKLTTNSRVLNESIEVEEVTLGNTRFAVEEPDPLDDGTIISITKHKKGYFIIGEVQDEDGDVIEGYGYGVDFEGNMIEDVYDPEDLD